MKLPQSTRGASFCFTLKVLVCKRLWYTCKRKLYRRWSISCIYSSTISVHYVDKGSATTAMTWLDDGANSKHPASSSKAFWGTDHCSHVTKRSLGLWVLFFSLCGLPPSLARSLPSSVLLSPVAPWECEGWNDTQWLTVAQGSRFWPWLAGSVWQLVSPLPSPWPAASTVVVVGLIGASLWSLTLGLTLNCSLLPTRLVVRKWDRERGCNQDRTHRKLKNPVTCLRVVCEKDKILRKKKKKEAQKQNDHIPDRDERLHASGQGDGSSGRTMGLSSDCSHYSHDVELATTFIWTNCCEDMHW